MHTIQKDLFGVVNLQAARGPWKQKPKDRSVSLEDREPVFPDHEIDAETPTNKFHPTDAQAAFDFLKSAFGGPQAGFVTRKPKSHEMAKRLARGGYLEKVSEKKGLNGQTTLHWKLTQRGVGVVGQTNNKAGR